MSGVLIIDNATIEYFMISDKDFEKVLYSRIEVENGDSIVTTTYRMYHGTSQKSDPAGAGEWRKNLIRYGIYGPR